MRKLTPWYPPEVKPVRKGIYEIRSDYPNKWFRYWDGEGWRVGGSSIEIAVERSSSPFKWNSTTEHWRGLTREAK